MTTRSSVGLRGVDREPDRVVGEAKRDWVLDMAQAYARRVTVDVSRRQAE
jgi:hypothetical protein